jgi:hypothetical protein
MIGKSSVTQVARTFTFGSDQTCCKHQGQCRGFSGWHAGGSGIVPLLKSIHYTRERGAIAQLGERIVRNDEVVGSIPTSSTKFPTAISRTPGL